MRLPLPPFLRRSARAAPSEPLNPSRTSSNASTGRRGAWFSMGVRGTRKLLWPSAQSRANDAELKPMPAREGARTSRTSGWSLRWLAVLIAIASALIAFTLSMD